MIKSYKWVYEHLICEFDHWDVCLSGLVEDQGIKYFCKIDSEYDGNPHEDFTYTIHPIEWTDECNEYLEDYRKAYVHWFHENREHRERYDGRPLVWFSDKWNHRNPIRDQIV